PCPIGRACDSYREHDCRVAGVGVRSAVAFMVVEKQLGDRAIREPADGARIVEASDREFKGLGVSAIGERSARHRSPPKETAAPLCVGNIPPLRSSRSKASKTTATLAWKEADDDLSSRLIRGPSVSTFPASGA